MPGVPDAPDRRRGVYGNPILPDFMVFLNYPNCRGIGTA
jgi:hypothetical protein